MAVADKAVCSNIVVAKADAQANRRGFSMANGSEFTSA